MTTYRDLIVWQKAMKLTETVYPLIGLFPKEEQYALAGQLRRAVISIPSNIAEGHGRGTQKDFSRFLAIARGSCMEAETQLELAVRLGYLTPEQTAPALSLSGEVARILTALIARGSEE